MNIKVYTQSAIRIEDNIVVYFDPYKINEKKQDADYVFITHDHYDHYDEESIRNVIKETTKIIAPTCLEEKLKKITNNIEIVLPDQEYKYKNISYITVKSYNIEKPFHPEKANYVGYKILLNGLYYYIMGDTDRTPDAEKIKTDICFVPIGGTYTMDYKEAADYINYIKPKTVIPVHYGSIVGDILLKDYFKNLIDKDINVEIHIN